MQYILFGNLIFLFAHTKERFFKNIIFEFIILLKLIKTRNSFNHRNYYEAFTSAKKICYMK